MGRIQGLVEKYLTGDTLLKSGHGYIFHVILSWTAGTAGNYIVFRDGTDGIGTPKFTMVFDAANGTTPLNVPNGIEFFSGIYVDVQAAPGAGIHLTVQFK